MTGFAAYEGLSGYLSAYRETVSGDFPALTRHGTCLDLRLLASSGIYGSPFLSIFSIIEP